MESQKKIAVVVLSGGQDSVTCLGIANKLFDEVHAITFNYGQKHIVEIMQARKICDELGVNHVVHEIESLRMLNDSALINGNGADVSEAHHANDKLPASFVPNRNALLLTIAHAFAQKVGADTLLTGVCETDFSGYPDCREVFIGMLERTLNIGYQTNIRIMRPLMHLDKAQTFALAQEAGVLDLVLEKSHTCYNGNHTDQHDWGYGCGKCPACEIRANGYAKFEAGEYAPFELDFDLNEE